MKTLCNGERRTTRRIVPKRIARPKVKGEPASHNTKAPRQAITHLRKDGLSIRGESKTVAKTIKGRV